MKFTKILAVLLSALFVGAAASCSGAGKVDTNCETGWAINKYEIKNSSTGVTEEEDQFICLKVTLSSQKVEEVWVNFAEMNVDEVGITLNRYNVSDYSEYSSTTYKRVATVTKTQVKDSEKGWVRIANGYAFSSSYLKISFYGGIKINEIVFINDKGEKMTYSVSVAKMILKNDKGEIYSKPYYTADEMKTMTLNEGSPLNLNDEQDKFDAKSK